ncbi:L-lysine cyclodeaminase [Clostridium puniceum]|uniref:L-lysine cyclodeaminase n=1 Tax=Clostridium puniceum TaxID=29367 RepID=A0A1S8T7B9_9CLOT|nr:ornithine cyclodeaminase family protein [Clostridium puniceum]OOM73687.1 L-lysine cyclodeaminase [Clostridium puniceum]
MLLLSQTMIQQFFSLQDSISAVKDAFELFSMNKVQVPLRTHIVEERGNGTFLCMPSYCADENVACVKVLSVFPANIQKGLPSIDAQILIMNAETGVIEGILDGSYITKLRTGAASGAALDILAKKECKKGALIGTGGQAPTQLEAMIVARKLEEIHVVGIDYERTKAFAQQMKTQFDHYGTKIIAVSDANIAVEDADVIITVTPSTKPVFDEKKIKSGATICGIGSYQPHMQELPPSLLARASKIYFDSQEAVLSESGDIIIPLNNGTITKNKFTGELGEVICNKIVGRENDKEIIIFKSVGISAQDLVTAKHIFDKGKIKGYGLLWE